MPSEQFEVAHERYHTLWPKSIYSSFGYYAQLLCYSKLPADKFVTFGIKKENRLPEAVRSSIVKKIEGATTSDLAHLFKNKHGLCTAWSILISQAVEEDMAPANIRFRFSDAGKHRLAFDDSGVLIDSAPKTVVQLVDGGSVSCGEFEYTVSSLEEENPGLKYTVEWIPFNMLNLANLMNLIDQRPIILDEDVPQRRGRASALSEAIFGEDDGRSRAFQNVGGR